MPLYVPKFQNGWEPPLDVLQEAPWETEGLASLPSDQVRTPAQPHASPELTTPAHPCYPLKTPTSTVQSTPTPAVSGQLGSPARVILYPQWC